RCLVMPKEIISKKPVSLPEVVTIFNKRKKTGELDYLQKVALDHAQKSSKLTGKQARTLIIKLMKEFELSEQIAIYIVNFMPETIDELRVFLQDASRVYSTDELQKILGLLKSK
ncbi:MAG: RNA polymerase Rpb4 family protein, partial [Candidatus Heimdallarchaeota archaeon]